MLQLKLNRLTLTGFRTTRPWLFELWRQIGNFVSSELLNPVENCSSRRRVTLRVVVFFISS